MRSGIEKERKALKFMPALNGLLHWFMQNPLGTAAMVYAAGVIGVLVYAYFEPQDQQ